jgi:hypothetical protein
MFPEVRHFVPRSSIGALCVTVKADTLFWSKEVVSNRKPSQRYRHFFTPVQHQDEKEVLVH